MDDDAFDFFDDEPNTADPNAAAEGALNIEDNSEVDRQLPEDDSLFEFGSDSFSSIETPASPASDPAPIAPSEAAEEPIRALPEDSGDNFADVVVTAADYEIEQASLTSAEALLDVERTPDDSLMTSASASSEEPFDFAFEQSEPSTAPQSEADTDPLEGIDPLDSVDIDDLAQATVLDPRGASGYDVSSSDLGPAPELDSFAEPAPSADQTPAATYEPDATVLAPEFQITPEDDRDLLEAELLGPDAQDDEPLSAPPIEPEPEIESEIEPEIESEI